MIRSGRGRAIKYTALWSRSGWAKYNAGLPAVLQIALFKMCAVECAFCI